MAVAKRIPESVPNRVIEVPKTKPDDYKSVFVDNKIEPIYSLLTYMEGASWTVNYYAQVVTDDTELRLLDSKQLAIYQQYTKVNGFLLKVQSPLDSQFNEQEGTTTFVGSALVNGFIVPNPGDVFIATIGNGDDGIFEITSSERKNFSLNSGYAISYSLIARISSDPDKFKDLENKVINTTYYNKDFLQYGESPLLTTEVYNDMISFGPMLDDITDHYFKTFINKEFSTLILPEQDSSYYDPFIIKTMKTLINSDESNVLKTLRVLNTSEDDYLNSLSIWDAVMQRNVSLLDTALQHVKNVTVKSFSSNPMFEGIRYSGVQNVLYPDITKDDYLKVYGKDSKVTYDLVIRPSGKVYETVLVNNTNVPRIKPVSTTGSYVLSEEFYTKTGQLSLLELMINDFINQKEIDVKVLKDLVTECKQWGRLEQFYYIPFLLIITRFTIKRF